MSGLNLFGKVKTTDGQQVEITKLVVYDLRQARRQNIAMLLEEERTFEDIRIMDKQTLIVTEVLTEAAKQLI